MTDIAGRVVVITGAADGIGRALADAFAAAGARLVLADINGPLVEAAGRELSRSGTAHRAGRAGRRDSPVPRRGEDGAHLA